MVMWFELFISVFTAKARQMAIEMKWALNTFRNLRNGNVNILLNKIAKILQSKSLKCIALKMLNWKMTGNGTRHGCGTLVSTIWGLYRKNRGAIWTVGKGKYKLYRLCHDSCSFCKINWKSFIWTKSFITIFEKNVLLKLLNQGRLYNHFCTVVDFF